MPTPTAQDAAAIIQAVLHEPARSITRFTTGLGNYVYDVVTESSAKVVVRIACGEMEGLPACAVYWSEKLRPLGVPLPRILHAEVEARTAPFPFLLLERLPGTDLNHVYTQLSMADKRAIAAEVVQAQMRTHALPLGHGFGYALRQDWPYLHRTWREGLVASLDRSRRRIAETKVFDLSYVDRVHEKIPGHEQYLSNVRPVAFLDDTTTKNVIVHEGRLSGIVDVDGICFGDPISTIALTRMSLLGSGYDLDYVDAWCEMVGMTEEQRQALDLYTTICCVDFMSEIGQVFNKDEAAAVDPEKVERLKDIYEGLLAVV